MKAIVFEQFGDASVLEVKDIDQPELGENEVVVDVRAAAINPLDVKIRAGYLAHMTGSDFPMVTGGDFAGVVSSVGPGVSNTKVGDEVFGSVNIAFKGGALAQKVVTNEAHIAPKPQKLNFEQACSFITVALTAYQALHDYVDIKADEYILINGASSNVGRFAVQFAKQMGLNIAASSSAEHLPLVESLGAQKVFNYKEASAVDLEQKFDVILDVAGTFQAIEQVSSLLNDDGRFITAVPNPELMKSGRCAIVMKKPSGAQLRIFTELLNNGELVLPDITSFRLSEVSDAHTLLEAGTFYGKIVLTNDL